jgi:hypothetical protein
LEEFELGKSGIKVKNRKYAASGNSIAYRPTGPGFLVDEVADGPKAVAEELLSATKD